jgi:aspartyl-tRNA(Asn)/glutamyl-tRNA(Gln) amidotransferase subunit B
MDYRYFPDPDLPPLVISQEFVDQIKANLPELPDAKKKRYISDLGLSSYDSAILSLDEDISNFFEIIIKKHQPKLATNWICVELFARINKAGINFDEIKITAENFTKLLDLIVSGTISGKIAKDVLDAMFETGQDPSKIVEEKGLKQVSNEGEIIKIITQILDENQDKVQQYKSGKDKLFGFFVGQVMKATKGQANPQIVNKLLKENL